MKDCFTQYSWLFILERVSGAADAFRKCSADVRANGVQSEVDIIRSKSGEFVGGHFGVVCKQLCIKQALTNAIISKIQALAARVQALVRLPYIELPIPETHWSDTVHWIGVRRPQPHCVYIKPGHQITELGVVRPSSTFIITPVFSLGVLRLEPPVKVVAQVCEWLLPWAGHRPPP